jgi:hypothetical protein
VWPYLLSLLCTSVSTKRPSPRRLILPLTDSPSRSCRRPKQAPPREGSVADNNPDYCACHAQEEGREGPPRPRPRASIIIRANVGRYVSGVCEGAGEV